MNFKDLTIEERLKRATSELLKLVQSGAPGSSDKTYDDLKNTVINKILNNKDALSLPVVSLMAPPMALFQAAAASNGVMAPLNLAPPMLNQAFPLPVQM